MELSSPRRAGNTPRSPRSGTPSLCGRLSRRRPLGRPPAFFSQFDISRWRNHPAVKLGQRDGLSVWICQVRGVSTSQRPMRHGRRTNWSRGARDREGESAMSRILVVDDEAIVRQLFAKVLESAGHDVAVAGNGRDAIMQMEAQRADLVLLDLVMAVMDGMAFLRVLRRRPEWKDVPVIVVSGVVDRQQVLK